MEQVYKCPDCNGKGFKRDWLCLCAITILAPFVIAAEAGEKQGVGKDRCSRCKGRGYIIIELKENSWYGKER